MLVTMGGTLIQVFVGRGPVAIRLAATRVVRDLGALPPDAILYLLAQLIGDNYFCRPTTITFAGWRRPDGACEGPPLGRGGWSRTRRSGC